MSAGSARAGVMDVWHNLQHHIPESGMPAAGHILDVIAMQLAYAGLSLRSHVLSCAAVCHSQEVYAEQPSQHAWKVQGILIVYSQVLTVH